ncbi:MAG: type II secretion system protein [Phycisphaerales bacterium]
MMINENRPQMHSPSSLNRSGFTLLELLVCIGIIGVLIGLLLPALAGARGSALQTVALSHVRSVGTQFAQFAGNKGKYPHQNLGQLPASLEGTGAYEPVGDELIIEWYPRGVIIATTDYFDHRWMWPAMLTPIDEWPDYWETWVSPRKDQELPKLEDIGLDSEIQIRDMISIEYSNSFIARPSMWLDGRDFDEASMLRPTRPHDAKYPSSKVMLWDDDLSYLSGKNRPERVDGLFDAKTPMAFADGHADALLPSDATEGAKNLYNGATTKLHNTPDGVGGRDY